MRGAGGDAGVLTIRSEDGAKARGKPGLDRPFNSELCKTNQGNLYIHFA